MTKKIFFCFLLVVGMFLTDALSVVAQVPETIYVDAAHSGSEDGTMQNPYTSEEEGKAYLQCSSGGYLRIKQQDGSWSEPEFFAAVNLGRGGASVPRIVLYILLATLALALILVGWQFRRRARQL